MKTFQALFQTSTSTRGIRETYKGNPLLSPGIDPRFLNKPQSRNGNVTCQEQIGQLSPRELEVLQLVAEGKANKETASELCISIKTVEKHRGSLMEKLGIHCTAGLTRFAIAAGIIECNP